MGNYDVQLSRGRLIEEMFTRGRTVLSKARTYHTLRELIFLFFADLGPKRKIKSNAKNIGRIIHRTALLLFQVRNPQN